MVVLHLLTATIFYLVQSISLSNESFDLPEHAVYLVVFLSSGQDLLVLKVIEPVAYALAKLVSKLFVLLLPLLNVGAVTIAVQDLNLDRDNEESQAFNHEST